MDWEYYISSYTDLKKNGITTKNKAFEHYKTHGKNEKRLINSYQHLLSQKKISELLIILNKL